MTSENETRAKRPIRDAAILLFALFFPSLLTWAYFVYGKGLDPSVSKYIFAFGKGLQFVFPVAIAALVLKIRWLVRKPNRRGLLVGGLFGLAVGLAIFFLGRYGASSGSSLEPLFARLREELLARLEPMGLASRGAFLVLLVFYSVFHSGLEEYYWRWFAFGRLSERLSFVPAALVANLAFVLHHVILLSVYFGLDNYLTWICALGVFVGGVVWQTIYRRADSIYGAWLGHGLIDAGIFAVGFLLLP
ncbi:MAG: CPBP family intramembrane metalloprotease [Thermoguttaceae bacterium]|nr:CPBP family intramembrane metalloprotease [Thermoguttaceae bacterium]